MWGLRFGCESLLVLSFSEQTRVFAVIKDGSTFEECANGAGVDTGETTVACGEFGDGVFAQVTGSSRVHLCNASDKDEDEHVGPGRRRRRRRRGDCRVARPRRARTSPAGIRRGPRVQTRWSDRG